MKNIILFIVTVLFLLSCTKDRTINPTCQRVYCLSDRYSFDTTYIKTDTIWPWGRYQNDFCNSDTLAFFNDKKLWQLCDDSTYEMIRYVIGNKISKPTLFK